MWEAHHPENGWLYVYVPMDYRINNLDDVTVTVSVTNSLGTVTALETAKPGVVTCDSGEVGSDQCTADEAQEAYVPRFPGACAYTYTNSSSTAPDGYSFESTTTVAWEITSTPADPTIPATLETAVEQLLPVSEVLAVVTCIGDDC